MIDKSVVIALLARDCNRSLAGNIPRIEKLRGCFARSQVVVVENDSKDGTKETLRRWARESDGVELIMNDFGTQTIPVQSSSTPNPSTSLHRIEKMARYRNMYMDYVRSLDSQPDYLIIIDVDVKSFSVEGVVEAMEDAPEGWGGLFANGQRFFHGMFPFFFDLYAFLPTGYESEPGRTNDELFLESRRITGRLRREEYVPCLSAFGGIGIYKWQAVKDLKYSAQTNDRSSVFESLCEHVPFNLAVCAQGFGNYVCRRMKLDYGSRSLKHLFIYSILPPRVFMSLYKLIKGRPVSS